MTALITSAFQLDLARPAKLDKPTPCIVFIHGGGWAAGNRKAHHGRMQKAAEAGFVAATISYRLVKDDNNRWPAQISRSLTVSSFSNDTRLRNEEVMNAAARRRCRPPDRAEVRPC